MVPVASRRVSRAPRYSGTRARVQSAFAYVAITLCGRFFQIARLAAGLITLWLCTGTRPTTPDAAHRGRCSGGFIPPSGDVKSPLHPRCATPGLGCSAFARRYWRNRGCFLFLQVLRWFTSLGSLVPAYGFSGPFPGFAGKGCPIRRSSGQRVLPPHRGFSQVATSFIAV